LNSRNIFLSRNHLMAAVLLVDFIGFPSMQLKIDPRCGPHPYAL
jgi:hypothetical protein